jgi:hypothetical protein
VLPRRYVELAAQLVPLPRRYVELAAQLVPLPRRDIELVPHLIALPNCSIQLAAQLVAFAQGHVPLAQDFITFPQRLVTLLQIGVTFCRQGVGQRADFLELEPELSAWIKAAKKFYQAHKHSHVAICLAVPQSAEWRGSSRRRIPVHPQWPFGP